MHHRPLPKADLPPHNPTSFTNAPPLPDKLIAVLLLDLLGLLTRLLLSLVPVLNRKIERIMYDLQLGADSCLDRLDDALGALRLLVLILVCADDVDDGAEGQLLELVCVFFDDGDALFKLGQRGVTQLVGAGQVWRDVGVGCLEVGMEGGDERVVCVVEEGEGLGAVGVGFVEFDRVVDDRVRVQMLGMLAGLRIQNF